MKVAIIDLGSNSIRMNIVELDSGKINILKNIRKIVRLSQGMGDKLLLREDAVNRTLETLAEFKALIDEAGVDTVRAFATAALRSAKNPQLFTTPASAMGIDFEIITGEREAYYDFMAVSNTLDVGDCVIVDIGGASTELILVKNGGVSDVVSIPFAAVNITERFFKTPNPTSDELYTALEFFREKLLQVKWLENAKNLEVVGMGGTVRALVKVQDVPDVKVHGFTMDRGTVLGKITELLEMPVEKRALVDGIGKGRADIIAGGVVALLAIMNYLDSPGLVSCVSSLREGVMYDIIKK